MLILGLNSRAKFGVVINNLNINNMTVGGLDGFLAGHKSWPAVFIDCSELVVFLTGIVIYML